MLSNRGEVAMAARVALDELLKHAPVVQEVDAMKWIVDCVETLRQRRMPR